MTMTRRSKIAAWIICVLVAVIGAIVIFLSSFNWNQARPLIDNKVSQAIGRPFAIRGNLDGHWRTDRAHGDWLPGPVFTADDIALGNPSWTKHKNLAHLDRISVRVSLWPLTHSTYRHFNGHVGGSDLHGTLTFVQHPPRPELRGKLWSNKLQFADLGPLIGVKSNGAKQAQSKKKKKPLPPNAKVLPRQPFRTDRWKAMDTDVRFNGKQILHGKALPIRDMKAHLKLDDGALALVPLNFGVAGGTLKSAIYLDGRATPMKARINMHVRHVKLQKLFPNTPRATASFRCGPTGCSACVGSPCSMVIK